MSTKMMEEDIKRCTGYAKLPGGHGHIESERGENILAQGFAGMRGIVYTAHESSSV